MDLKNCLAVAERAARQGGTILREMAGSFAVAEKGRSDLVTSADLASQEAITRTLLGEFPDHTILGEEGDDEPDAAAECRWIVDPLDGTTNYVHGLDLFCVSIALERRGELVLGVIYDPSRDQCFKASAGGGAFLGENRIRVSPVHELRNALLVTGFPPRIDRHPELLQLFGDCSSRSHGVRRLGSAALDLAYVAWGRFDGFYSVNLRSWDAAAGVVLIREAGGTVTNIDGSAYDVYTPDIVSTNGRIHEKLVAMAASSS